MCGDTVDASAAGMNSSQEKLIHNKGVRSTESILDGLDHSTEP